MSSISNNENKDVINNCKEKIDKNSEEDDDFGDFEEAPQQQTFFRIENEREDLQQDKELNNKAENCQKVFVFF
jgi:hypothetical protein